MFLDEFHHHLLIFYYGLSNYLVIAKQFIVKAIKDRPNEHLNSALRDAYLNLLHKVELMMPKNEEDTDHLCYIY